jgi:hypothetical protein
MAAETFITGMTVVDGVVRDISIRSGGQDYSVVGESAEIIHDQAYQIAANMDSCCEDAFADALIELCLLHQSL